ncbi:maleylacetoacetate isomerase, partial [bacterium]|nr:maleylacetoacetate isomerase [bacterium]
WRSSCSWRVRWALDYKSIPAELQHVSLLDGECESDSHRTRNPLGFVPVLERLDLTGSARFLSDSTAIASWLDEAFPQAPSLFWGDSWTRARIRSLAGIISSDTQPIQNLTVLHRHSADPAEQKRWAGEFIHQGLLAFEKAAKDFSGKFSTGDELSWADMCLIPQCYNAERFSVALDSFPTIQRVLKSCENLPSYLSSHPSRYEQKPEPKPEPKT